MAFTRTILSRPEPPLPHLYRFPLVPLDENYCDLWQTPKVFPAAAKTEWHVCTKRLLNSRFQHVLGCCCVVSRHARRASAGLAPALANGCVALTPFQPLCIYVYHCVLIRLFCRYSGSVITPIVARSLTCIYHVPVYMLIFKVVIYIQWLTVSTLPLLYGKSTVPRCSCNGL